MNTLSKEDAIFFLDAIGSTYSPNITYRFNKRSPYMEFLKDRNSEECRRFLRIAEVGRKFDLITSPNGDVYMTHKDSTIPTPVCLRETFKILN